MTNKVTRLTLISLLFAYFLAIGMAVGQLWVTETPLSLVDKQDTTSYVTASLFSHAQATEASVKTFSFSIPSVIKTSVKELQACSIVVESIINHFTSHCMVQSERLLIRHRKTDLIYPFNYFW